MLDVTDKGTQKSEQLSSRARLDNEDLAFMSAVDILDTYVVSDFYDLANRVPFLGGDAVHRLRVVRRWVEEGLLEK